MAINHTVMNHTAKLESAPALRKRFWICLWLTIPVLHGLIHHQMAVIQQLRYKTTALGGRWDLGVGWAVAVDCVC